MFKGQAYRDKNFYKPILKKILKYFFKKFIEETSIHTRKKVGSENKNKVFTEKEKADYLNNLRNKYKDQKSIEKQFAEVKLVPEKDKKHWAVILSKNASIAYGYGYME